MLGKAITSIINADSAITSIIGSNLYPVGDYDKGTPAIYYIVKALPHYNNNGQSMTDWQVEILTQTKDYSSSWPLSLKVKETFDKQRGKTVGDIKFTAVKCLSITDEYEFAINGFGQKLVFEIKTSTIKSTS